MSEFWFRRRRYGWGWTPSSWQGWTIFVAYITAVILAGINAKIMSGNTTMFRTSFIPEVLFYTIVLLFICLWTGEPPKWQWGKKK